MMNRASRSCGASLDVFDFKDETEGTQLPVSMKWKLSKSKSCDDSPGLKYQFLECFAGGVKLQSRRSSDIEHVDVDTIDDNSHSSRDTSSPSDMSVERLAVDGPAGFQGTSGTTVVKRCNLTDGDSKVGNPHDPSIENCHTSSTILENQMVDGGASNADDSSRENSPCTSDSVPMEDNGHLDGEAENNWFHDFEMQVDGDPKVILHVDYLHCGDKYYPAPLMIFSKSSFKMKDTSTYENVETHLSSWDVEDIVVVHCRWCSKSNVATVKVKLLSKDAHQAEKGPEVSGIEELNFAVYDPRWYQRQEKITSLHHKYDAAWNYSIDLNRESNGDVPPVKSEELCSGPYFPDFHEPFEDVIYPEGDADAVSISKRDVDLLRPETFINDTIIDFYVKYLKNKIQMEERQRYHFFNSFFFRKLADLDKNPSSAFDGKAAFQRVHKWTRKINLFEKDYIFIPVNYNLHWSLIVICHIGEVSTFKDKDLNNALKVPCILHMDSIRGSHSGLKDLIQSYLREEWKERQKEISEDDSSAFSNLRFVSLELPQQENCYDCGLFLLHYVELFLEEAPKSFSPFHITKFSNFLKANWFIPAEVSLKRAHIQRLIYELVGNRSDGSAPTSCSDDVHSSDVRNHGGKRHDIEVFSGTHNQLHVHNANSFHFQHVETDGMTMLGVMFEGLNKPGLQLVERRNCSRSNSEQYQHYDLGSYCGRPVGAVPIIGEVAKGNEDTAYSAGDTGPGISWRMDGIPSVGCSSLNPSSYHGPGKAWVPMLTDLPENDEGSTGSSGYQSDDSEEPTMLETLPNSYCDRNSDKGRSDREHSLDRGEFGRDSSSPSDCDLDCLKMSVNEHRSEKGPLLNKKENLELLSSSSRGDVSSSHPTRCDDESSNVPEDCLADKPMKSFEDDDANLSKCLSGRNFSDVMEGVSDSNAVPKFISHNSAEELEGRESRKNEVILQQQECDSHSRCASAHSFPLHGYADAKTIASGAGVKVVERSSRTEAADGLIVEAMSCLPECFASAYAETLVTPTDDSQGPEHMFRSADQIPSLVEEDAEVRPRGTDGESQDWTCVDNSSHLVVEHSSSDSDSERAYHGRKKRRLTPPSDGEGKSLTRSPWGEVAR